MIKQITIISVKIVSAVWIKFSHETSSKNYGRDNKFCQKHKCTDFLNKNFITNLLDGIPIFFAAACPISIEKPGKIKQNYNNRA
jgi:hypothetical protein